MPCIKVVEHSTDGQLNKYQIFKKTLCCTQRTEERIFPRTKKSTIFQLRKTDKVKKLFQKLNFNRVTLKLRK